MGNIKPLHLVFIDDNPDFLDLIAQELESSPFRVTTIFDSPSEDIMGKLIEDVPDILFIDLFLASIEIETLCAYIKEQDSLKDVPFFLISYSDKEEIDTMADKVNAMGAISKPINLQKVESVVRKVKLGL